MMHIIFITFIHWPQRTLSTPQGQVPKDISASRLEAACDDACRIQQVLCSIYFGCKNTAPAPHRQVTKDISASRLDAARAVAALLLRRADALRALPR